MEASVKEPVSKAAVRHQLMQLLNGLDESIIRELIEVGKKGGIHGQDPKADLYARIAEIEGQANSLDLKSLELSEAEAVMKEFKERVGIRILPEGGRDRIERYFADVTPLDNAETCEPMALLVECGSTSLDDKETDNSIGAC